MEKLSLQDLELSIPSINELTTRKLMGGGYSDGNPNVSIRLTPSFSILSSVLPLPEKSYVESPIV